MEINRRQLLTGAGAAAGAYLLSNPGAEYLAALTNSEIESIHRGATATEQAVRGEQTQNTPPKSPQQWQPGQFIKNVEVDTNRMAFTLDDGPSPYNTDPTLRTLARYGIKATYYLPGVNVMAWPEIAKRIVDEGHELGNHSVYHTPYQAQALADQIGPNQEIIYNETGVMPVTNRAPGLTRGSAILAACAANGLYEAHTSMNTSDWKSPRWSANRLIDEFAVGISPGTIALHHDGGGARPTPDALPGMIEVALSRGYTFHTVTELVNSGIPKPGTNSYSLSETSQLTQDDAQCSNACQYDPKTELLARLEDVSVKGPERSRIVEALANIEEHEKAA